MSCSSSGNMRKPLRKAVWSAATLNYYIKPVVVIVSDLFAMADMETIIADIQATNDNIRKVEQSLEKAQDDGDRAMIASYTNNLTSLNNVLAEQTAVLKEQQREKNILLEKSGICNIFD